MGKSVLRLIELCGSVNNVVVLYFCSAKCSLWVSGLGSTVSASDLKTLFSPFGSVSSYSISRCCVYKSM